MRHLLALLALAAVLAAASLPIAAEHPQDGPPAALLAVLEKSRTEKKGVTLFLPGQSVAIVVTSLHGSEAVEGRNQEYGQVVVRLDQVLGAAQ